MPPMLLIQTRIQNAHNHEHALTKFLVACYRERAGLDEYASSAAPFKSCASGPVYLAVCPCIYIVGGCANDQQTLLEGDLCKVE
jgi:hypothetical protein